MKYIEHKCVGSASQQTATAANVVLPIVMFNSLTEVNMRCVE